VIKAALAGSRRIAGMAVSGRCLEVLRLVKMIPCLCTLVGGMAHRGAGAEVGRIFAKTMDFIVSSRPMRRE